MGAPRITGTDHGCVYPPSHTASLMPPIPAEPAFPTRFHVAVDVVAMTISRDGFLQVAVVQRASPTSCIGGADGMVAEVPRRPHDFALPGGHVNSEWESLVGAAARELQEETGITVSTHDDLVQIGAYGDPHRDPRGGRTVSVAFVAFKPSFDDPIAGSDAARAQFIDVIDLLAAPNRLEFDHATILRDAISRVRDMMERTAIALNFCGPTFAMGDLRRIYEVMFAKAYDPGATIDDLARELRARREARGQVEASLLNANAAGVPLLDRMEFAAHHMPLFAATPDMSQRLHSGARLGFTRQRPDTGWGDPEPSDFDQRVRLVLDPANFQKRVLGIDGFVTKINVTGPDGRPVVQTDRTDPDYSSSHPEAVRRPGRPRIRYRRGGEWRLDPPLVMPRRAAATDPDEPRRTRG